MAVTAKQYENACRDRDQAIEDRDRLARKVEMLEIQLMDERRGQMEAMSRRARETARVMVVSGIKGRA